MFSMKSLFSQFIQDDMLRKEIHVKTWLSEHSFPLVASETLKTSWNHPSSRPSEVTTVLFLTLEPKRTIRASVPSLLDPRASASVTFCSFYCEEKRKKTKKPEETSAAKPLNATYYFSTASGVDTCIYKLLSRIVVNLCVGESCSTLHLFIYRLSIFFYRSFRMFDNLQKKKKTMAGSEERHPGTRAGYRSLF